MGECVTDSHCPYPCGCRQETNRMGRGGVGTRLGTNGVLARTEKAAAVKPETKAQRRERERR